MRAAYDWCLATGIPHPDYLLGRDSLDNFNRRGLTSSQWSGCLAYLRVIPAPIDRLDFALAGLRSNVVNQYRKHAVEADHFIPAYGKRRQKPQTGEQLKDQFSGLIAAERTRRGEQP